MDWQSHIAGLVEWYATLGQSEATKAYAWAQVKAMAAQQPELYAELPEMVTKAAREKANADRA